MGLLPGTVQPRIDAERAEFLTCRIANGRGVRAGRLSKCSYGLCIRYGS
jgi:hypothetical protein